MQYSIKLYFYDATGNPYAYTEDDVTLYSFDGRAIGYIDTYSIYGFDGTHLGFYEDGNVRDHNGDVLLFTKNSRFGCIPLKPVISLMPRKGLKQRKSLKSAKALMPRRPLKSRSWSTQVLSEVF